MRVILAAAALALACSATAATAAGTLVIRQTVADYAKWRPIYDAHGPVRTRAGLSHCIVQSSASDMNDVLVVCNIGDMAKAKAFSESKDLAAAMARAGVTGKPSFYFLSGR